MSTKMSSNYPSGLHASTFELLIRLYWSPTAWADWEREVLSATARADLVEADMVIVGYPGPVKLSERGLTMAKYILNLPLPRQAWLMPPESDYEQLRAVYSDER